MTLTNNTFRNLVLISLLVLVALSRLFPHPFNFTPIAAIALFGGASFRSERMAILLPVAVLLVSDLFIQLSGGVGFYKDMFFVYFSFVLIAMIGRRIGNKSKPGAILVGSLAGSVLFFLITNFGSWLMYDDTYARSLSGLVASYVAGIPFFRGTLTGDLFYNFLLFGSFYAATLKFPALSK